MRYCLSVQQTKEYLEKADEIKIEQSLIDRAIDVIQYFPDKDIVLMLHQNIDWVKVNQINNIAKEHLKICLDFDEDIKLAQEIDCKFFMSKIFQDIFTLSQYIKLGVCAAYISAPLTHNLSLIENLPIEIRVFPNFSGVLKIGKFSGFTGGWFRPEDFNTLEMIDVAEFPNGSEVRREQALYRIYAEEEAWPGDLNLLIDDLNEEQILNRMLPENFQSRRNNCRQKCLANQCHFCDIQKIMCNENFAERIKKEKNGIVETVVEKDTE